MAKKKKRVPGSPPKTGRIRRGKAGRPLVKVPQKKVEKGVVRARGTFEDILDSFNPTKKKKKK